MVLNCNELVELHAWVSPLHAAVASDTSQPPHYMHLCVYMFVYVCVRALISFPIDVFCLLDYVILDQRNEKLKR